MFHEAEFNAHEGQDGSPRRDIPQFEKNIFREYGHSKRK
jgi:hypothetical protein